MKSIGYILHEVCDSSALIHWNKLRCEIRRHKFSVTAAQVSPLSRYLLLTRINIPPGLITQYSCTRTYIRACKRDACNRNRCVTRASNIIGDAGMKIIRTLPDHQRSATFCIGETRRKPLRCYHATKSPTFLFNLMYGN